MMRRFHVLFASTALLALAACSSHYEVTGVSRSRIVIDSAFDGTVDTETAQFMAPYKQKVDSVMSPIVGRVATDMAAERPESNLSNLLCDILVWAGAKYGETIDFAVYNMGGIRAALVKGDVSYGDLLDVAPFENDLTFLTLKGCDVEELFREMAAVGGEGVSGGVCMVADKSGKLLSATVGGQPIDPAREYRIATLDYVAQGNDGMSAFKKKTNVSTPQAKGKHILDEIVSYFSELMDKGLAVESKKDGRITISEE